MDDDRSWAEELSDSLGLLIVILFPAFVLAAVIWYLLAANARRMGQDPPPFKPVFLVSACAVILAGFILVMTWEP